ncbi:MAG: hypothetical protein E2P04_06790 [Acidobacteria bacterium]|nr:MAG: hypothetical protein E2P04_06790 [Acidobacteriota bacterium]
MRGAVRLMPEALRQMMQAHQKELLDGMLSPGSSEDQPEHWQHPRGEYGSAARKAEEDARALVAAVERREPLAQVSRRFGTLAHWIADVNDPLHAADRDPNLKNYYRDYQSFLQKSMSKFPLVFLGYRSPTLTEHGPGQYLLAASERSREYAESVRRAYHPDGTRVSREAFDTRSVAFGVGSLSYSNAVNDIMRVWLWAWEACHGDITNTPYPLEPAAAGNRASEDTSP